MTVVSLNTKLTNMRLNRDWSKTVLAFVNEVSKLVKDHRELTNNVNGDEYYIEKVKATFSEHKDIGGHIKSMDTQESLMERRFQAAFQGIGGHFGPLPPMSYETFIFEVKQYAIDLDARYAKSEAKRRANKAEKKKKEKEEEEKKKKNGGRDNNSNGGRANGSGRGNGDRSHDRRGGPGYISSEQWMNMSYDERQKIFRERERARSANNANTT